MTTDFKNTTNESSENNSPDELVTLKITEPKFKVMSIEKTATPEGMIGDNWHQYVIGQGAAKIEGMKSGSLTDVTLHAKNVAEDLNNRSKGKLVNQVTRNKGKATPPNPPAPEKAE
ncbi:MAG: hypothetical protein OEW97_05580 [Gammaproteobacteria bacterium]|nr:hypothetical protein [Gammaproteobacteria bacterium]